MRPGVRRGVRRMAVAAAGGRDNASGREAARALDRVVGSGFRGCRWRRRGLASGSGVKLIRVVGKVEVVGMGWR